MDVCVSKVQEIIGSSPQDTSALIAVLQDIQREFNYLPPEAITETDYPRVSGNGLPHQRGRSNGGAA
jgi:hypothetical protein